MSGSENEVSEDEKMDIKTEVGVTNVTKVEAEVGDMDVTKVEVSGGIGVTKVEAGDGASIAGVKEEEKEASTSGIASIPLQNTRINSPDLRTNTKIPLPVTKDSLTTTQSPKHTDTSVNQAREALTQSLTTSKPTAPAIGDRVPFTLRSRMTYL